MSHLPMYRISVLKNSPERILPSIKDTCRHNYFSKKNKPVLLRDTGFLLLLLAIVDSFRLSLSSEATDVSNLSNLFGVSGVSRSFAGFQLT